MTAVERIVVVGAGAIGGWIAGKLALAGEPVSVLARGGTLEALRSSGLHLTEGDATRDVEVHASDDPVELGPQDVLVIAVKAPALAEAAEAARPMIGAETLIVPMLNGVPWWFTGEPLPSVDPGGRIAAALPQAQIIGSVVHAACSRPAPNEVVVKHADRLILGQQRRRRTGDLVHQIDGFADASSEGEAMATPRPVRRAQAGTCSAVPDIQRGACFPDRNRHPQ